MKQRIISTLLILALALSLSACATDENTATESEGSLPESSEAATETPLPWEEDTPMLPKIDGILGACPAQGSPTYASAEERESWRAPLAALLANELRPDRYPLEDTTYTPAVDPNAPSIVFGKCCALFDLTMDGTPELLVSPTDNVVAGYGADFFVYDIRSGDFLGQIRCYDANPILYTLERESGMLYPTVRADSTWQGTAGYPYVSETYVTEVFTYQNNRVKTHEYLYASYEGSFEPYAATLTVTPEDAEYRVADKETSAHAYARESAWYLSATTPLLDTASHVVYWEDVEVEGEDFYARGARMADALLSSGQAFVRF